MPLSRARNAARKRLERAAKKGVMPQGNLDLMVLPLVERKEVLKRIALSQIEKPISAGHQIAAIKELNLMEHVYDNLPNYNDNRQINIIVADDKSKETLMRIMAGEGRQVEQPGQED